MTRRRASRGSAGNGQVEADRSIAGRILSRLRAAGHVGVGLADVIDLTTAAADLLRWVDQLRQAGWIVERFFDGRAPRYRVILSHDWGERQNPQTQGPLFDRTGAAARPGR